MSDRQTIIAELDALAEQAQRDAGSAPDATSLEQVRVDYLGRKGGRLSTIMRGLGSLDPGDRPAVGARANEIKARVQQILEDRQAVLGETGHGSPGPTLDLTLPSRTRWRGSVHPVNQVIEEVWQIFKGLGFTRARGPEAETEWYNFVALNTPLDHPAADEQDTLYLEKPYLLRSHTSPVQIRTMQEYDPPIRILAPGMAYRRDTADATHTPAFAQIEGLVIDEGVTFVDFRATLAEFARRFWGPHTRVRFRPSFFPFTEPSAEMDVKYPLEGPDGQTYESEWLEIMGAGMVDPAVLEHVGYDPERYTGWAFGMGPARVAMTKYGISDIRMFTDNDLRFLTQFQSP
jgi:phenylalanyl-tRNA synthetase alpha chain